VFEPGQITQNATNEPKIAGNAVVADGKAQAEVAANFSPNPGLDKRANEPKDRANSPVLERGVVNPKTEEANPESEPPDRTKSSSSSWYNL
jgi:hypothetical protein